MVRVKVANNNQAYMYNQACFGRTNFYSYSDDDRLGGGLVKTVLLLAGQKDFQLHVFRALDLYVGIPTGGKSRKAISTRSNELEGM